jgi:hypothetical protein
VTVLLLLLVLALGTVLVFVVGLRCSLAKSVEDSRKVVDASVKTGRKARREEQRS